MHLQRVIHLAHFCPSVVWIKGLTHVRAGLRRSPPLRGTALATRIGFERPHADMAASLATDAAAAAEPDLQLSLADARRLPPVVLMSGAVDKVVPW